MSVREPLRWSVCYGWGIGTLGAATLWQTVNVFLLNFMTDFIGIAAATAGLLVFISKIYDAVTDPLMGWLSDRTRTRLGRRKPYIAMGGIMLGVSSFLLFGFGDIGSSTLSIFYYALILIFYSSAVTVFNIPYLAMPAEMTEDKRDLSRLMTFRVAATGLSIIVSSFVPLLIDNFGGGNAGYRGMGATIGIIVAILSLKSFLMTLPAPVVLAPVRATHAGAFRALAATLRAVATNRPFVILLLTKACWLVALSFAGIAPFYFRNVVRLTSSQLTTYFLCFAVAMTISAFVLAPVANRWGKVRVFQISLVTSALLYLSWQFAQPGEPLALVYGRSVLFGFFAGGALLAGQAMLPETMHYDRARTGLHREGVFSGFYSTMDKVSSAIAIVLAGVYLQSQGYQSSVGGVLKTQSEQALNGIVTSMSLFPAAAAALAAITISFYRIPEVLRLDVLHREAP